MIDVEYFRRLYFYVQMVGYEEEAQGYSMEMTICRPDEGEADSFITKYQILLTVLLSVRTRGEIHSEDLRRYLPAGGDECGGC